MPALFATFPNAAPATLLGTNKATSIWGTAMATLQYGLPGYLALARLAASRWRGFCRLLGRCVAGNPGVTGFFAQVHAGAAGGGARLHTGQEGTGRHHAPRFSGSSELAVACGIGAVVGFYDGFFGPGTGSFFVFLIVRLLGAPTSCMRRPRPSWLNTATNLSALLLFSFKGHVWWHFAVVMALANVAGSLLGTHMALKHGTGFVRGAFLLVVSARAFAKPRTTRFCAESSGGGA